MPPFLLSLFLNRYVLGALAIAAAIGGAWWWHSAQVTAFKAEIDAGWAKAIEAERAANRATVAQWVVEMVDRDQKAAEARAKAAAARRTVYVDLVKEVPTYVTPLADSRCIVPRGFVQHHDAAAAARAAPVPESADGLVDADSGLALSAVERTVTENYGACHELRAEVEAWRAWYPEKRAAWERLRQELVP